MRDQPATVSGDDLTQAALDLSDLSPEEWQRKWGRRLIDAHRDLTKRFVLSMQVQKWLAEAAQRGVATATECLKAAGTKSSAEVLRERIRSATANGTRQIQMLLAVVSAVQSGKTSDVPAAALEVDDEVAN